MQYESEILSYRRINKKNKVNKENKYNRQVEFLKLIKNLSYCLTSLLISRVILLNGDNTIAPFGIAYLITMFIYKDELIIPVAGGCFLGYVSIYNKVTNLPGYLIIISTITALNYFLSIKSKKAMLSIIFSSAFIEILLSEFFIRQLTFNVAFLIAFLKMICIIPLYFILEHSIICLSKLKTKHLFSGEEIISMSILMALILSGTWGINIVGISIRNILALIFILILSYINGSSIGAASGIAIGTIIGISSNNMIIFISVYGLCGLIAGIFKESGKALTGFSYVITFIILMIYSNVNTEFKLQEIIIAVIAFFAIPNNAYEKINLELNWEKKQEYLNKDYVDKIKYMILERLSNFSGVLYNISDTLDNLANNDKLVMKNKSTALVDILADRVCSTCNMNSVCWKKEGYYTYLAFTELIQKYQDGKRNSIPKEIEKKCFKRTLLLKNTQEIVNNYIINEMWRKRLVEGREILSSQVESMAGSLKEIMNEFNSNIKLNTDAEKRVRKILEKSGFKYSDIFCFQDKNDRLVIRLSSDSCGGAQVCFKKALPLINEAVEKLMCISDEGCKIDPKTSKCTIHFEETPKFYVSAHVARQCKHGEKYNGDSYSFGKMNDGTYMCIISDGMGSGPEAGQESKAAVDLIEKFTKAGISKTTAINTVNTIMSLKFSENEKFSTLDLGSLDLYTGNMEFIKVGASASFIKSGDKVETITCKSLPIGVIDKVDLDVVSRKVKNGDIIVMLSDGILDYDNENTGKTDWIVDYLKDSNINSPRELVEGIVARAKELCGGKPKDDMTAIVCKVYSLY